MSEEIKVKTVKVKLVQKAHDQDFPYYSGAGKYYGVQFEQVGDELVADVDEDLAGSLIAAKKFKKLTVNAYKELVAEASE